MAKTGATSTQVVRRKRGNLTALCLLLHYTPNHLGAEAGSQDSPSFVDRTEEDAGRNPGGIRPSVNSSFHPIRDLARLESGHLVRPILDFAGTPYVFSGLFSVLPVRKACRLLLLSLPVAALLSPAASQAQVAAHFHNAKSIVASGLNLPYGVAVDSSGNVYIADFLDTAVHKFAPNGSGGYTQLSDVANTSLDYLTSVAVDSSGNVYIADPLNNAVHEYAPNRSGGTPSSATRLIPA